MTVTITKTVKSSLGDYTSLSAWEAGEQADLVTLDQIRQAECYSFSDTTAVTIAGWISDATRYPRAYTPVAERHSGVWDNTKYRISANNTVITVSQASTRIEGLQVELTGNIAGQAGVTFSVAGGRISYCIVKKTSGSAPTIVGINTTVTNTKVWNNVVYDFIGTSNNWGIRLAAGSTNTIYAYNNTVYNCATGYILSSGTMFAKNCIAQSCTDGFSAVTGTFGTDSNYNISDLVSDAPGANSKNSATVTFVNAASKNFLLHSSDIVAKDAGTNLSTDANLAFADDIKSATRSGVWDIGADESGLGGRIYQFLWDVNTLVGKAYGFKWSVRAILPLIRGYFVEVDVGYQLRQWTASGTTNVWRHDFSEDDPTAVKFDGTTYAEQNSLAACASNSQSWWVDRGTVLYINTGTLNPNSNPVEITSCWHFARTNEVLTKKLGAFATLSPIFWDGRISAVPEIRYHDAPDSLGGGNQYTFGDLVLQNEDNKFQRYAEALLYGRTVRAYIGKGEVLPDDFSLISKVAIQSARKNRDSLTLSLGQDLSVLLRPVNGGSTYSAGTLGNQTMSGQQTPFIIGTNKGVPAYLTGTSGTVGTFQLCGHNFQQVTAIRNAGGTALSTPAKLGTTGLITGAYATGQGSRFFNEAAYVDCVGYGGSTLVGESMLTVLQDRAGVAATDILTADFSAVDTARAVKISGWFGRGETIGDVLDTLSKSAFVSWGITPKGKYTAWVRKAAFDAPANLTDWSFESGGTAWLDAGAGTHTGTTLPWLTTDDIGGTRVGQMSKPSGTAGTLARIYQGGVVANTGTTYAMSAWAALQSGTLRNFRLEYADAGGTSHLGTAIALAGTFQRYYDFITTGTSGSGTFSIYADYNGTTQGTALVDEVTFHPVKIIYEYQVANITSSILPPRNNRVNVRYLNLATTFDRPPPKTFEQDEDFKSSFVSATSAVTDRFYTLETMSYEGVLWGTDDAQTVANAILAHRGNTRFVLEMQFLDTESLGLARGDIIYFDSPKHLFLPGGYKTLLVTEVSETIGKDGPRTNEIKAERIYRPVFDWGGIEGTMATQPVPGEYTTVMSNITINGTAVAYSTSVDTREARYIGVRINATSAGVPNIKVEWECSDARPTVEGTADTAYIIPDNMTTPWTTLSDTLWHSQQIFPSPASFGRLKITGNSGNPTDTVVNAKIFLQG